MARDHSKDKEEIKTEAPQFLEREINLPLINAKINEALNILYKLAEKAGIKIDEE